MKYVYTLYHLYELENACDEVKFLGAFSSEKKAREAQSYYSNFEGFREHPEMFCIDCYEINKQYWTEGFIFYDPDTYWNDWVDWGSNEK